MLNLARLQILFELRQRGTLAEVAEALHLSPSAVSQQLSTLERETGTQLLRKSGRRVTLTPEAHVLCEHTDEILRTVEAAESDLATVSEEISGTVRMAAFQSVVLSLMPAMLTTLRAAHPQLRVTLTQHEPEDALERTWMRDFDLVVAEQYPHHAAPHHDGLDREELMRDPIRLAVPPTSRDPAWSDVGSLLDVRDAPWVMEPAGAASRHWALQACRQAGFEPDIRFETADLHAHLALIEAGQAVALMPDLMRSEARHTVRYIDLPDRPERTIFTSVRRGAQARPAISACRAALVTVSVRRC
ncbi:LysR substrate-binding domain-containing protein [Aeromicrobium sp. CF3.5]|uniref:LysR substrate-binding domain-containing protein n=1 Tax=Aeromicrobium sp. CF3.5 TaxID=3373078 RepID=UPI003EE4EC10